MRNILATIGYLAAVGGIAMLSVPWAMIVGGGILFVLAVVSRLMELQPVRKEARRA